MNKIIVQCDPDLEDLIPGYINNRVKDIVTLRECLTAGNFDQIRIIGHSMKGSGGGYGFDAITALGDRMEIAALANDLKKVDQSVCDLEEFINRLEVVYS